MVTTAPRALFSNVQAHSLPRVLQLDMCQTSSRVGSVQELGHVPIIAEDLGVITDDVNELRIGIGAPGMVVLQFAWGSGATNIHLPHNHYENSVCYPGMPLRSAGLRLARSATHCAEDCLPAELPAVLRAAHHKQAPLVWSASTGASVQPSYLRLRRPGERAAAGAGTHDNETMVGWWKGVQGKGDQQYVEQYSDEKPVKDIAWTTIRLACRSVSQTCVFQMQVPASLSTPGDSGVRGKAGPGVQPPVVLTCPERSGAELLLHCLEVWKSAAHWAPGTEQDVMRLDNSARMNFPGTVEGNWAWRVGDEGVWGKLAQVLLMHPLHVYAELPAGLSHCSQLSCRSLGRTPHLHPRQRHPQ